MLSKTTSCPALLVALLAGLSQACTAQNDTTDTATLAASLEVNEDGSDPEMSDAIDGAPLLIRGCGFEQVREHLREHPEQEPTAAGQLPPPPQGDGAPPPHGADAPPPPGLDALASAADGESSGAQRPHRRGDRLRQLARIYDTDQNHSLSELEAEEMRSDLELRCENKTALLVLEFDVDSDGALSDSEWDAAHQSLRARFDEHHAQLVARFDLDGDGELSEQERLAAHESHRAELEARREAELTAADEDGDGELSDEERAALTDILRARVRGDDWTSLDDLGPHS